MNTFEVIIGFQTSVHFLKISKFSGDFLLDPWNSILTNAFVCMDVAYNVLSQKKEHGVVEWSGYFQSIVAALQYIRLIIQMLW